MKLYSPRGGNEGDGHRMCLWAGGRYGTDCPMVIHGTSHGTALTFGYLLGERLGCG